MFKVNDLVVYPGHGVYSVAAVSDSIIQLKPTQSGQMSLLVRPNMVLETGLRAISSESTVKMAIKALNSTPNESMGTWNVRYREMLEKIKGGDLMQIAEVIRDLTYVKESKDLSFGERKMLDSAKEMFEQETSAVLKG